MSTLIIAITLLLLGYLVAWAKYGPYKEQSEMWERAYKGQVRYTESIEALLEIDRDEDEYEEDRVDTTVHQMD